MISAIAAVDNDWGIGFNGDLLEHIPEDLKYFKQLTENHAVIMGKKTWDSLPKKPLKNRLNIVITNKEHAIEESVTFVSLGEVISRIKKLPNDDEWFVIGGGLIYEQLLPFCDRVYITKIYKSHENIDTYFPNLDNMNCWNCKPISEIMMYQNLRYQFLVYEKIY